MAWHVTDSKWNLKPFFKPKLEPKCFYWIGTQAPEGAQEEPHGREALQVHLGGVQCRVCPVGHPVTALQEAHRGETLQVPPLRQVILPGGNSIENFLAWVSAWKTSWDSIIELFISVGNIRPKLKWFFKLKLSQNVFYFIAIPGRDPQKPHENTLKMCSENEIQNFLR